VSACVFRCGASITCFYPSIHAGTLFMYRGSRPSLEFHLIVFFTTKTTQEGLERSASSRLARASWINQSMGPFYRYRRASTSASATTSSSNSSSGGGVGAAAGTAGFAAFFRSLPAPSSTGASPTTKSTFRFFARDQGGFYSSHGPEALEVACRFYSTETVIRQQAGLPSLSISYKLFASRVLPALLASGAAVEIWEPAAGTGGPGGKEEWVLVMRGSPGNTTALEELMLSSSSADGAEAEAEAAALLGTSVMMAVQAQGGKHGKPLVLGE